MSTKPAVRRETFDVRRNTVARRTSYGLVLVTLASTAVALVLAKPATSQQEANAEGKAVYDKWCAGCHGDEGRGDGVGAAHLLPKPRDFTRALYQVRSTATGEIPTDDDIRHVVDNGMPGTSMPGWTATLSSGEREAVARYVKSFSNAFRNPPTPVELGSDPGGGQSAVDSGRALFRKIECWKCHGNGGRGDGQSAPTLKDDWNNPIRAADLSRNWLFNGGGDVRDIYRRLRTGLDGTPMPAFGDLVDANVITDGDLWRIAHYVRSLSPEEEPRVRDVVSAPRVDSLPAGPADSAWDGAGSDYFPLVGQVIIKNRWFAPTVSGVWVQAVHNGQSLAIRVSWTDPTRSPDDGAWRQWRGRLYRSMASDDSAAARDTATAFADRLMLEFPTRLSTGMERPYFLLGTAEQPVYLWRWESEPGAATEVVANGAGRIEPLPAQPDSVTANGEFADGQWRVQFVRTLTTADSTNRLQFVPGRPIPMAIFAWDGSNGETDTKMSIGSWVNIHLGEPARAGTVVWPLLAMLGTGGLGLLVVTRAQRAAGTSNQPSDNGQSGAV